jgi:Fic family protein
MTWNWQKPDWPHFSWEKDRLTAAEQRFLLRGGTLMGLLKHLGNEDRDQLVTDAMSTEAVTTSEIEGEILDRASVQSSIRRQLGLAAEKRRSKPGEEGIAEMMVDLYRSFAAPLSRAALFRWHAMVLRGRRDLKDVGRYRTSKQPMQVVSSATHAPKVHFEAPPALRVPSEMASFIAWFERTKPDKKVTLPALTRAGIAHLYFESIHPFEDGNGRIGRAIAEKALAQGLGHAALTALAATILARRKSYYAALEAADRQNEITNWLAWFAGIALEAQQSTVVLVEFLIEKTKLLDRLKDQLNVRQKKALLRMFREGPQGFKGGLSAGNYGTITGASPATTTRDLVYLVEKGALNRTGERKHARYQTAVSTPEIPRITVNRQGLLIET